MIIAPPTSPPASVSAANERRRATSCWASSRQTPPTEIQAMALLKSHPHFRARRLSIQCRYCDGCLRLIGTLDSFFLKQLAQETMRAIPGVQRIQNDIEVQ